MNEMSFNLQPASMQEFMDLAEKFSRSTMVPKDYQGRSDNIIVAWQFGSEVGLKPMQALQSIAVINGRPSIWGDGMLALVRGSGLLEDFQETITDTLATCRVKRKGESVCERTFSLDDARKAGLLNKSGPWTQYPKRMLQLRARGFALRDAFADVLKGLHMAEEAQDIPQEIDMGAAQVADKKHETKTAAVKEKLQSKLQIPKMSADEVMQEISSARTLDQLELVKAKATLIENEEEKNTARKAFKQKYADLKSAQKQEGTKIVFDQETGEISQGLMKLEDIAAMISHGNIDDARESVGLLISEQDRAKAEIMIADATGE